MALKVQDQSSEVAAMAQMWGIVEPLIGGTAAMRANGTALLPKWPAEDDASYKTRLSVATLFPALNRTISVMSGKPFAKQIVLGDDVPAQIEEWCDNVDQQGNSLHSFAAGLMQEVMGPGLAGILVDYPKVVAEEVRTQADESALGVRPYFVLVRHHQILGWKTERIAGRVVLTQLRIAEMKEVEDGLYGVKLVKQVRVLNRGSFEIWQEDGENKPYVMIDSQNVTLQEIPFVPFYGLKKGFMCAEPPLLDLAYLNVKHWQSQSDQDTILHVARVPVLAIIGADQGEDGTKPTLVIGGSAAVHLPTNATMEYVEHTGAAIDSGAKSLEKLEDQMITTGAELLVIKPGEQKSATQSNNDAEANKSDLQRIVENFEDSLDQALQFMADWVNLPEGGHVSLFKDFGASSLSDASAQLIVSMQQAGLITKVTAIREQQRRGMLAADIDPDAELEAVAAEGPALGELGDGIDPVTGLPVVKKPGNAGDA